ncbi:MAG TPA: hypothetical protein VLE23_04640 [Geminicoccaceae bacterium]|nr:hypothetical protein [Geminicoccaceae bacterium]
MHNPKLVRSPEADAAPSGGRTFRVKIVAITLLLALAVLAVDAASFSAAWALIELGVTRDEVPVVLEQLSKVTKFLLKFDVGGEQTVAAWLSSVLMLLCAIVLLYVATMKRHGGEPYAMHWLGLSVIFLALSMDETVGFHEMTIKPLQEMLGADGAFRHAWVIPAMVLVGAVGMAYLGFLWHLERAFRLRCVLAGGLFVGGAVGFEILEGALADYYAQHPLLFEAAVHLEDTLEFAGVLIFLHGLLTYILRPGRDVILRLT